MVQPLTPETKKIILWITPGPKRLAVVGQLVANGWQLQFDLDPTRPPLSQIADMQPALIVVMADTLPAWVAKIRSDPATRRIPAVAIADTPEQIAAANYVGIKYTVDSAEATDTAVFNAFLKPAPDQSQLAEACAEPLPELALKGLHEFNAHEFFECHETLEAAWNADPGPAHELYRLILQVGLAYYQIERGNYSGALKMFLRTQQWFGQLPDRCRGVDLAQLRADAAAARTQLEALGAERIAEFDRTLIKPIHFA